MSIFSNGVIFRLSGREHLICDAVHLNRHYVSISNMHPKSARRYTSIPSSIGGQGGKQCRGAGRGDDGDNKNKPTGNDPLSALPRNRLSSLKRGRMTISLLGMRTLRSPLGLPRTRRSRLLKGRLYRRPDSWRWGISSWAPRFISCWLLLRWFHSFALIFCQGQGKRVDWRVHYWDTGEYPEKMGSFTRKRWLEVSTKA